MAVTVGHQEPAGAESIHGAKSSLLPLRSLADTQAG